MSHLPFDTRLHVSPSLKRSSLITPSIIKLNVPYKLPSNTLLYWDDLFCLSPQFSCEFLESTDWIRFVSVFRAWLEELISWDLQALESSLAEVLRTCFSSSGEGKAILWQSLFTHRGAAADLFNIPINTWYSKTQFHTPYKSCYSSQR